MPFADHRTLHVLPFLGGTQTVPGQRIGDRLVFNLPTLERGAVAWFEDSESIQTLYPVCCDSSQGKM